MKVFSPYGSEVTIEKVESSHDGHLSWQIVNDVTDTASAVVTVTLKVPPDASTGFLSEDLYVYSRAGETRVRTDISVSALIRVNSNVSMPQ